MYSRHLATNGLRCKPHIRWRWHAMPRRYSQTRMHAIGLEDWSITEQVHILHDNLIQHFPSQLLFHCSTLRQLQATRVATNDRCAAPNVFGVVPRRRCPLSSRNRGVSIWVRHRSAHDSSDSEVSDAYRFKERDLRPMRAYRHVLGRHWEDKWCAEAEGLAQDCAE